ncbi:alpha/beta hydrolase [Paenibacillus kribbensis]|uniref:alpha/beta hydrolase n=1 Tax=Paenibacillus kribbensis TaxID=172713 RepID=UPI000838B099|nr:alpha/beta hydrolase-fold protein [Paenibacillus kribbensis]
MRSRIENREYHIFIAVPVEEPPVSGYPVIYVLDANSIFGTMVEAVRVQGRRPDKTGVVPAIIVGIGYPTEAPFHPSRFYDLTLPGTEVELPVTPNGEASMESGGAEDFLSFIEDELKPEMERDFHIDRSRQAIFGHSLGGLFVLHTLFTRPDSFQVYVAGSPSIHWGGRVIMEEEKHFLASTAQEQQNTRLLIGVGELEAGHSSGMQEKAKELAERLTNVKDSGLHVEFREFADEGHISVLPVLASRAVRFASVYH